MKKRCLIILLVCLGVGLALPAAAGKKVKKTSQDIWTTDLAAARQEAARQKKYLLLDFTGSDWCGWCRKLEKEVFSQELFRRRAPQDFILVRLDFPKKLKQDEKLKQRNQELSRKYGIRGFPTIILTDAEGVEFARTGYRPGGPQAYLDSLKQYVENFTAYQRLLAEAETLRGVEKARKLDAAAAKMVANGCRRDYDRLAREIIALDKDGRAGLKAKYEIPKKLNAIRDELNKSRDFDQAMSKLDELAGEARRTPKLLQQIYLLQAGILIKGKGEQEAGIRKLELARLAAPETRIGQQLVKFITQMKARNNKAVSGVKKETGKQ